MEPTLSRPRWPSHALRSVSLELKYHYKEQHESQSRQSVCVGRSLWIP